MWAVVQGCMLIAGTHTASKFIKASSNTGARITNVSVTRHEGMKLACV